MSACWEAFSIAEFFLLLSMRRRLIGRELDPRGVTEDMPQLILMYSQRLPSTKLHIGEGTQVHHTPHGLVKALNLIEMPKHLYFL